MEVIFTLAEPSPPPIESVTIVLNSYEAILLSQFFGRLSSRKVREFMTEYGEYSEERATRAHELTSHLYDQLSPLSSYDWKEHHDDERSA